mmetsp:Transcript_97407/g.276006  ORF Transcript_97407/g.276006 Transcript_97407/m.276006 type:complete len:228 (+) Transcript_97407:94-777(+)
MATGPSASASIIGVALFRSSVLHATRPTRSLPSLRTWARLASLPEGLPEDLQRSATPEYGISPPVFSPCAFTYSIASSTVAPLQPPWPPHSLGFGTQSTSSCSEKLRVFFVCASKRDSSMTADATAQQEPQALWFLTSCRLVKPLLHSISRAGCASTPVCRTEYADGAEASTWRQPRSCESSSSVWSARWLTAAVHSLPGRRLCASMRASRASKRALRCAYSGEPLG